MARRADTAGDSLLQAIHQREQAALAAIPAELHRPGDMLPPEAV